MIEICFILLRVSSRIGLCLFKINLIPVKYKQIELQISLRSGDNSLLRTYTLTIILKKEKSVTL